MGVKEGWKRDVDGGGMKTKEGWRWRRDGGEG